jgi:drug/metabolite transporter (DMT)-like permease
MTKLAMRDRPSGFANPRFQLALSVAFVTASELLLKRGASDTANLAIAWSWTGINSLVSPLVWWGIICVIASFLSWLYVLKYIPLTIAFPLSRVVDVLVPLCCWILLGEEISARRWCGIALVIIGLAVVAKPVAKMEKQLEEQIEKQL